MFLIPAIALSAPIALTVMLAPWERLPLWAQAGPPLAFFGVVVLAELAASEQSPSVLALMLLPVLWLAANGTRMQVAGLPRRAGHHGHRRRADHRRHRRRLAPGVRLAAGGGADQPERAARGRVNRRSEARYRTLVDHLPDMAVLTFDRDLRYDLAAGRGLDTLGVDPAAFEGKTLFDVVEEERRAPLEKVYREALDGRESSMEWRSARNPSRDLWLRGVPLRDDDGRVQGGMVVSQDVTERNRAEAAAREAQELFRRAFEDGEIGMAIVSLDGHYLRVNRAMCRILGRSEDQIRGRSFTEVTHPEDCAESFQAMDEMLGART